jgi:hypothetical protein
MKTFRKWLEDNGLSLPVITEEPPVNKKTIDEKKLRGGIAHWAYPPGYARHEYPAPYFTPTAADAVQKLGADDLKK